MLPSSWAMAVPWKAWCQGFHCFLCFRGLKAVMSCLLPFLNSLAADKVRVLLATGAGAGAVTGVGGVAVEARARQ